MIESFSEYFRVSLQHLESDFPPKVLHKILSLESLIRDYQRFPNTTCFRSSDSIKAHHQCGLL